MLDGVQLDLNVETIQPGEAYILYTDVHESWDDTYEEDLGGSDDDYMGVGPGRYVTRTVRARARERMLTGVITDDRTLDIVKGRMEDYAHKWEANVREQHVGSKDKPNFDIKVTYILETAKRLTL